MDPAKSWRLSLLACTVTFLAAHGSASGFNDPRVRSCLKTCGRIGCAGNSCLSSCHYLNDTSKQDAATDMLDSLPVYRRWKDWVCASECRYHCVLSKDTEDAGVGQEAIGYRKDWCLARAMANQESSNALYRHLAKSALTPRLIHLGLINEPVSVTLSALNLLVNFFGLLAFLKLVYRTLPSRSLGRGLCYPYASLWTYYGLLATLYWFAQCVSHTRSMAFDKHSESTLEVVQAAFALLLAIVRVGNMESEQSRVVVVAPSIAFLGPHLMYINLCTFDYGLNIQVCVVLGTIQYLLWITWTTVRKHPARNSMCLLALLAPFTVFLRLYDFSYFWEVLDSDALWIASTIPSSFIWWRFAKTDAAHQTKTYLRVKDAKSIQSIDTKKQR